MKKLSLTLILSVVLSAIIASASPFSDVPLSHWAYDAVNTLSAKGILMGYPDGTFKGNKPVTRYAMAMVVAKMLANVEQMLEKGVGTNLVTKSDLQTLEKLTVEFADELALLGVKVTALEDDMQVVKEDISNLKKDVEGIKEQIAKGGLDKVKLSGDLLVRHSSLVHNRDYAPGQQGAALGNVNNSESTMQLRLQFKMNIDENITAVARWHMLERGQEDPWGVNVGGIFNRSLRTSENNSDAGDDIDLAYLHIKNMFRFGGDFTFGRNFYSLGHGLLLSDYVDAVKYYKRSGDVDISAYSIYDAHTGSWKDDGVVDFRQLWALSFGTRYRDHDLYLNFYGQDDVNLINRYFAGRTLAGDYVQRNGKTQLQAIQLSKTQAGGQESDIRWDIEFGARGPIGKTGHWDYDLSIVYSYYNADVIPGNVNPTFSDVEMQGWAGYAAVKWDSKKEWAAKLAYAFGTDEFVGAHSLDNDRRYDDGIETPFEDISRGNNWFRNGLLNMYDVKVQVEYRPKNTKHYFRLAADILDEIDDNVSNDMARKFYGVHRAGQPDIPAGSVKTNTIYDQWNNYGVSDPKAYFITFEYRYQLAENTRLRVGYTYHEMTGDAVKAGVTGTGVINNTVKAVDAGRGVNGDYNYNLFWAEIYSRF